MKKYLSLLLSLGMTLLQTPAFSQDEKAPDDKNAPVEELEEFTLEETVDDPVGIIPERPTDTLFGTGRTVLELPRSVSMIEGEMLDRYAVTSVTDFISIAAGTYTDNFFGIPGSLDIRGSTSDTFFRGFRRVENRGNYPTPITATSRVEIVRGPPTPYYGAGKVGGFMNFIPKTARTETAKFIDKPTGKIRLTAGTYSKKKVEFDLSAPITIGGAKGGYSVYTQFEDSRSYYKRIVNRLKLIQYDLDLDLNERWNIKAGGMYSDSKLIQNPGWNRVTQDLIDNGTYITGTPAVQIPDLNGNGLLDTNEAVPFSLDKFNFGLFTPDPDPNLAITNVGTTHISRKTVFTDPLDIGNSETFTAYFDLNGDFGRNFKSSTQFFYDSLDHQKYTSYGFTADYNPYVYEIKQTFKVGVDFSDNFRTKNVIGVAFRDYQGNIKEAFSGGLQIFDRRDLTIGPTTQDRFASAFTPGRDFRESDTSDQQDFGFFYMFDGTILEKIGVVLGYRFDSYDVDSTRADTIAFDGSGNEGATVSDSDTVSTFNGSVNITLKRGSWTFVPYFTYANSTFPEVDQGGGLSFNTVSSAAWLSDSDLVEGGLKLTGFDGKLFVTFDVYQQNRTRFDNLAQAVINGRSTGYELEARWAPDKHWAFTLTGTWQKTVETPGPGFGAFTVIPPALLGLTPEQAFGGRYFSGSGFTVGNSFEADGQPDKVISIYGSYTGDIGTSQWGLTLGSTYVTDVFSGRLKAIKLPDYWLTNITAFIESGKWRLGVKIKNAFDTRYFVSQAIFNDSLVLPGAGTTAEATLSYSF